MRGLNNSIATTAIRLDNRRALKDGKYPVKLDVYFNGRRKRYGTHIKLTTLEWSKIDNPKLKDDELKSVCNRMNSIRHKAEEIISLLGSSFTFEAFESLFFETTTEKNTESNSVYSAMGNYVEALYKAGRVGTANSYNDALKSLRNFCPNLYFDEITVDFLNSYEIHMLGGNKSPSTIGIYLRSLRTIVNVARNNGVIADEQYPFGSKAHKKYEIPRSRNVKKSLDERDVAQIIAYTPENENESWARDIWLFSFYCNGMNMADIFNLKYDNIHEGFIRFYRRKTILTRKNKEFIEIYISQPIHDIISRHGSHGKGKDYIFDVLDAKTDAREQRRTCQCAIQKINRIMKRIADKLRISSNLTTYVARHSWATLLLRKGVPTAYISKGLGHSSFATTEQYLADFSQEEKKKAAKLLMGLSMGTTPRVKCKPKKEHIAADKP